MSRFQWNTARGLASAFLAGSWKRSELLRRGIDALGASRGWLKPLIADVLDAFPHAPRDARDALSRFIQRHPEVVRAWSTHQEGSLRHWYVDRPRMKKAHPLTTVADVGRWLELDDGHLEWLSDRIGLERHTTQSRLQNYRYTWRLKRSGGFRLLEAPKPRLKALQRRLLLDVLDAIPPHDAAHGFRSGRSTLTHARLHVNCAVVVRFDLEAFFAHVHTGQAFGVFRSAGYPEEVARSLIALCTNQVPLSVLQAAPRPTHAAEIDALFLLKARLRGHHLPQGAPTSPALANRCSLGLDVRLSALARAMGLNYSRYADDLIFSGERSLANAAHRLEAQVGEIAHQEGFHLNARKTRVMAYWQRQRVTGIVVNRGVSISREDFDLLKATLHNCVRDGPEHHSRGIADLRSHLLGRISWVEYLHPSRGERLRKLFECVRWERTERGA